MNPVIVMVDVGSHCGEARNSDKKRPRDSREKIEKN